MLFSPKFPNFKMFKIFQIVSNRFWIVLGAFSNRFGRVPITFGRLSSFSRKIEFQLARVGNLRPGLGPDPSRVPSRA